MDELVKMVIQVWQTLVAKKEYIQQSVKNQSEITQNKQKEKVKKWSLNKRERLDDQELFIEQTAVSF